MAVTRLILTLTGLKTINSGLGFALSLLIVMYLGANELTDALFIAMFLPVELARMAVGRFPLVMVPILEEYKKKGQENIAPRLLGWWLLGLVFIALVLALAAPILVKLMAPGLPPSAQTTAANLIIILSPSLVLLGLFGYGSTLLYQTHRFIVPELAQFIWRVVAIAALLVVSGHWGVRGFSVGLVLAALLQWWAIFIPGKGLSPRDFSLKIPTRDWSVLRLVLFGLLVAMAGLAFNRATVLVDRLFASLLDPGSISLLFLADRLARAIPILLATSLFTVYLPELSKARLQDSEMKIMRQDIALSLMALGLPLGLLLFWASGDLMQLFVKWGRLTESQAHPATMAIQFYSLGIPSVICGAGLRNTFLVERNLKSVAFFGALNTGLTLALDALLYSRGIHGLALASSLTVWIVLFFLWFYLKLGFPDKKMYGKIILALVIMGVFLFLPPWKKWIDFVLFRLGGVTIVAVGIYAVMVRPVLNSVKSSFSQ